MKLAIRMDDISPDMNREKFMAFKALLDEYGIKPLIGVVPDNGDPNLHKEKEKEDFWDLVRNLQESGWTVAMHGYRHIYTTRKGGIFPLNHFSEFAGVPEDEQEKMLRKGSEILKRNGISTDIFMAPGHSYDRATLRALRNCGYTRLTDGFGNGPYLRNGMVFYPISFLKSRSLKKKRGVTTLVVHTNEMEEKHLEGYRRMFREQSRNMISYSDYFRMPVKKRGIGGRAGEYLLAAGKHYLVRLKGGSITSCRNR